MQIDVCIATYKRPALLRGLLDDLLAQQIPAPVSLRIIVVDNDPAASARRVCEQCLSRAVHVDYYIQADQNLALTRNRALEQSDGELIAFIDDDESAPSNWLATLLATMNRYDADVVFGPVRGLVPEAAPRWLRKGRFFTQPPRVTGAPVALGYTGNVMMRASMVRGKVAFNPAYGVTGGEDTDFFHRLGRSGARMIWCEEALLSEHVHTERLCLGWLVRRAFSRGQLYADIVERPLSAFEFAAWFGKRIVYLVIATVLSAAALPFSRALAARYAIKVASNAGQVSSVFRYRMESYRN